MKEYTLYRCEYCDFASTDAQQTMAHEAAHLGLTVEEYYHWESLCRAVPKSIGCEYTKACNALADFETKHNLTNTKTPDNFFN